MTNFNNASIQELSLGEMDMVGGGTDWDLIALGLATGAAAVVAGATCPPLGGALGTIAVHTVAAGLATDD